MFNLGNLVVKYRKIIIAVYIILLLPAAIGYLLTDVNYDLLSYLPDDLNSKQGEVILEEEFSVSGEGLLMARGKKDYQVKALIEELETVGGVEEVLWLGDYADIYVPRDFIEPQIRDRFVSGETVLLQVRFIENARSETTAAAVAGVRELIENDHNLHFGGEPAIMVDLRQGIGDEAIIYTAFAVFMILIVLTLATKLYLDPVLFLTAVGVAIVINMGSNYFQGEISFMTASIAAVMQLGISLDYAIFLMHRFEEEKSKIQDVNSAMVSTINKTATTVASSGLTTIGGFAALIAMQNGLGSDMGIVLGKGIIVSLVVTLTFLPAMILILYPYSKRYQHRVLIPSFKRVSGLLLKLRWVFLVLFLVIGIPAFLAQVNVNYYYSTANYLPRNSQAAIATDEILAEYGAVDIAYLITPERSRHIDNNLVQALKGIENVDSVMALSEQVDRGIPELVIPEEVVTEFTTENYRKTMIFLEDTEDEQSLFATVDMIRNTADTFYGEHFLAGQSALTRDMASLSVIDARTVAFVSVAAIGLVLAISFKSLSLPFILVLAVQLSIWLNLGLLYFQDNTVASLTPIIIGAIQLGATIDYAILYTVRYRENLTVIPERLAAAKKTIEDTGRSILTSALILFSATFGISIIAGIATTREMTMLIGRGAMISMLVMFTLLPALLLLTDRLIGSTTISWPKRKSKKKEPGMQATPGGVTHEA